MRILLGFVVVSVFALPLLVSHAQQLPCEQQLANAQKQLAAQSDLIAKTATQNAGTYSGTVVGLWERAEKAEQELARAKTEIEQLKQTPPKQEEKP